jgi:hypothetical protein
LRRKEAGMTIRNAVRLSGLLTLALGVLLIGTVSCGGGDDSASTATVTSSPTVTTAKTGPGRITITSTPIEGKSGKILLVYAISVGGGERLAGACVGISSVSFAVPGVVMTDVPVGNDPCAGGTSEMTFAEGSYQLTAGVYQGGQQTPESETTLTVKVAGDVTAQLDGVALSE